MKKSKMFILAIILLDLVFVLPAVWAGGGQNQSAGPVTLRFAYWGGDARIAIYNQICQRYEEDTPNTKIALEPSSWNDYFTKLSTHVAGGAAPDIISMHARYVKYYSSNGVLLSLDNLVSNKTIDLSSFSQAGINMGKVDGKQWMISQGMVTTGLFVNETLFNEVGIPLSRLENMDWPDYEKLVIEIHQKSGKKYYGAADDSFTPNDTAFTIFMRSRGKDFFTPEGKIGFGKDDLTEWLAMHDRMRKAGAIASAQHSGENAGQTWEQGDNVKGIVATWFLSANRLRIFQEQMPKSHLVMARVPNNKGRPGEYLEGAFLTINSKSKYQNDCAKFINYWVNSPRSLELFRIEHGFPASTAMNKYVYNLLDASNKLASQFMDKVTSTETLPDYVLPPDNWTDILSLLGVESQAVAYGTKSISRAVDDFFTAVGKL